MPQELPIACTLGESELAERVGLMRELGADALLGAEMRGTRAVLRFRGARQRVEDLVKAESRCCAFFEFTVGADEEVTTLEVRAPAAAEQVLREFVGAIAGDDFSDAGLSRAR